MRLQLPFLRRGNESSYRIKEEVNYGLTPVGKTKAEQHTLQGPYWDVLDMLDSAGPSTVGEIAQETKMPDKKVKSIIRSLLAKGYVRKVGSEG